MRTLKHGKRPNRAQKLMLGKYGLNPNNWLIVKNLDHLVEIAHRETGRLRKIERG